jgi:hypothetical protein
MGDIEIARQYLKRALTILEASLGPDHPSTRSIRKNYNIILGDGAIAQGDAVGERGVHVAGNVGGSIITGDSNVIISTGHEAPLSAQKKQSLTIDDYGWAFVRSISPTSDQIAEINKTINELRDRLSKIETIQDAYSKLIMYGAVARGTAITPIADIDVLILFNINPIKEKPRVAYEIVQDIMTQIYRGGFYGSVNNSTAQRFRSFGASTIIEMKGKPRLEVTPAVLSARKPDEVLVPDWKVKKWVVSGHEKHAEFADSLDQQTGGIFKALVKMVKHWYFYSPHQNVRTFHSFVIESLVADLISPDTTSLLQAFLLFLEQLRAQYDSRQKIRSVPIIGMPGEKKGSYISETRYREFMNLVDDTIDQIRILQDIDDLKARITHWRKILGDRFPENL